MRRRKAFGFNLVLSLRSKKLISSRKSTPVQVSVTVGNITRHPKRRSRRYRLGYADGYSRRLTNQTEVLIKGKRYPVVGTICMDQIMMMSVRMLILLSEMTWCLSESDGGETRSAGDIADTLGTISYEVLTNITARVPRVYLQ